jgi:hypothetical protein
MTTPHPDSDSDLVRTVLGAVRTTRLHTRVRGSHVTAHPRPTRDSPTRVRVDRVMYHYTHVPSSVDDIGMCKHT